jgi:hypothetical protein
MARIQPQLPHDFPDRVIRDALRQSANMRELIASLFPNLVERLDFKDMSDIPREFLLDDYRERESDLLVEAPFRDRPDALPLLICLLVEHRRARGEHAELVNIVRACQSSTLLQQEVQNMSEQTWLNWEQEIALTAAQKATERAEQARDAAFARNLRASIVKMLEQRFDTVPAPVRQRLEAANVEKLTAALEHILVIKSPEELPL